MSRSNWGECLSDWSEGSCSGLFQTLSGKISSLLHAFDRETNEQVSGRAKGVVPVNPIAPPIVRIKLRSPLMTARSALRECAKRAINVADKTESSVSNHPLQL